MRAMVLMLVMLSCVVAADAQEPRRPRIVGIAHAALYVHDIEKSRAFYETFLGYDEAFPLKNPDGTLSLTFIKINDRHYIELFPEREAGSDRLAHIAVETNDAEGMRLYLKARGITVPDKVSKGRIGNTSFNVKDPDGHTLEFVEYEPTGMPALAKGQLMTGDAVSRDMRHLGILVGALDQAVSFYGDVLGFKETWRGSRDGKELSWVNLQVPDGDDYVEFMLGRDLPEPAKRGSQHHIALFVTDIAKAEATLRARAGRAGYTQTMEVRTGINRKRQLNLYDPDGTRSELMEPDSVDGKPAPSSTAPPPKK
ncbi:MAG: VOC family protein [Acidobacteria bacterium]|nr:VOC family protein [Acidobacteriota bacterium]